MGIIRAPFNFVPLSEKVFIPEWANQISQDIPFSDGVSGTIDMTITAKSPIFIRNGHTKEDGEKKNSEYNTFSHITLPNGRPLYFIPATSIKGEVRNLLEIMSFSKMDVDKRAMFARRDMRNREVYPLLNPKIQKSIHCGWLKRQGNEYTISDCGRFMRISQREIDNYIGRNKNVMYSHFSKNSNFNLNEPLKNGNKEYDPKSADFKYELMRSTQLQNLRFRQIKKNRMKDNVVRYDPNGSIRGSIVLTGQSSKWTEPRNKYAKGKYYEFVFPENEIHKPRYISQEKFDHFSFIYKDTSDWDRIKRLIDQKDGKGVPVFFRAEEDEIIDFGMAYLYKMPYEKSVWQSLYPAHKESNLDLAQCIFGLSDDNDSKIQLKGRVQFGNAFTSNAVVGEPKKLILGSPKASYYPFYVHQDGNNGHTSAYKTYDDGRPNGWKRYYVRNRTWEHSMGSDKLDTTIYPLKEGAKFSCTISFHNLKPIELGALLCALTFDDNSSSYHQLGQAKPYGYGMCKYNISNLNVSSLTSNDKIHDTKGYIALFKECLNRFLGDDNDWTTQPQISQLIAMSSKKVPNSKDFQYMELKDHANAKKGKEYLKAPKEYLDRL